MKTVRLLIATTLALAALGGLVLALEWTQPTTASVEDAPSAPAAPQTLPPPWLSDDDVADAPYHSSRPTVDGRIDPGEYAGAGKITFPGYGGDVEVFFKQDSSNLYVAFELPDKVNHIPVPDASFLLDTNNDGGSDPQSDDFWFLVWRNGGVAEWQGNGSTWISKTPITWTWGLTETMSGWSVEFSIPFTKLGINAGTFKVLGLALSNGGIAPIDHYWPAGADPHSPGTWGDLVSSSGDASIVPSGWDSFYWKPGPWEDYAPSGMPDFDQNQQGWQHYDGPAAAANSLWWFDSKFETPDHPPPAISDTYRLVWSYDPFVWDDHHYSNTVPLIDDLATKYFGTNQGIVGTDPISMFFGIHQYLRDHGLWDDYIVTLVEQPSFDWVADEVMRSEDVILLMGFYEEQPPGSGNWARVGGHYVNVAGVDPMQGQIAFSDPFMDNAEWGGPGRVLSGTLIPHQPIGGHTSDVHNDAGNVSHDVYQMVDTNSPGGTWGPMEYPLAWEPWPFIGANPNPFIDMRDYGGNPIQTEVEFALTVSPYTWKASGEWHEEEMEGWWVSFEDYAPNGVPDFDQKQDTWGGDWGLGWKWTFCGPAAAANSLWWFDSKFEPSPVGPPFPPPPWGPIPPNDNYPLVQSYDPAGLWDDHDPLNVDDPATPWPPGGWPFPPPMPPGQGEFVEDLAVYFQTDQIGSGTVITNLYTGIEQYITDHSLRQGYVITLVESPEFWWVAEEVEVSEDVILLLGFWEQVGADEWQRIGGHYLTLPGIDKQGGLVAFSDPYYDGAEYAWPYAYPTGWPTVMGRVADGWLTPHPPWGHASDVHNDAGNISHDVYYVVGTDSPGGSWGPWEYVEGGYVEENFLGQNGDSEPYAGGEVQAEVEWAVAVSPVADVWITKTVVPTVVVPGGWVTFTITFGNGGSLPAEDVVISDVLPSGLVNPSVVGTWSSYGGNIVTYDTFTWTVGSIPWQGWGVITVTAQVSPTASGVITNTAEIATSSVEQYQISQYANTAQATFTVKCVKVTGVTLVVTNTGTIYTDTVVHFNADIAPNDADKPYNYRITTDGTPGGVMASSADPLLFTDTFATTGTHTVEIAVWNCAMTEAQAVTDSVDVTVSEHVVCVDLTRIIIAGATTGYPGVYTFTTSYQPPNATPVIAYVWDNGGTAATSVRTLGVGTHMLMVTATNCTTALVTDTYTIVISATPVCTEVTGVTLVVTNTGAIYTDTVVHFNADIAPDDANKPYNYRLTTDGTPGGVMASSADPLLFTNTFATTGTHTVEIAVWNCSMSASQAVTDTVVVTVSARVVCVDLSSITIAGATTGYPGVYTFTTSYQPLNATPPIVYAWDNGDNTATSVRTMGVGTHTLMVTATNCTTALVTDTHPIVISATPVCTEVTGVTLVVTNTGAIYTDTVVHFNADIAPDDADKPYNYRLTTDGTPGGVMASSADPLLFTDTFATTGTHTVEIAVWNCLMSASQAMTDTVDVTVSECIPPAGASFIYAPLNPLTGQTVVFTGSVALGDPPPTYTWDFGDGSGSGNSATHVYNSAGTYTVWMTATNSCGQAVYSDTVSVCEPAGNASIQYAPAEPWVNQTVFFTATATGSGLITYAWAADDGWMASGITATHAFTALGNHTVWMTATNGCGQDYASEVILVRGHGVDLQPPSGSATGKPGGWITYTLTLYNAGNVTDTYNITGSVTGEAWPTNWPATVGPVAGGGNAQLDVTVQISSTANDGDWSRVVITATSQGDGSKKAASVLTTTVTIQPVVRDVEIAPHTAAQTGDVGTTVTYTLRVTNTGTISDYFNLSVSGPAWGTVLSVYGLDLKPGEGQPVAVYVQIPAGAASGAQDAATVTARSAVAPAVADSAILTTTAYVPTYGVELTPLVAQQAGHPGDVMTYTLTVRNTGERDDTYTLSKGLHTWPTTLSVSSVGPLAPNGIAQFNVTVQIPASVLSGAFGTVQVTATSQKDNSKSDTAVLTTTAVASTQPITRGVTLTATITAREGIVGDWITYTLRVTNTGNVADFFNLTWQGNTWPVDLSAYGLSLGAGQGADVLAYVQPPLTASDGATDTVTIKATSANDATATDGVALTTTARWRHVYLPLVLRNHQ